MKKAVLTISPTINEINSVKSRRDVERRNTIIRSKSIPRSGKSTTRMPAATVDTNRRKRQKLNNHERVINNRDTSSSIGGRSSSALHMTKKRVTEEVGIDKKNNAAMVGISNSAADMNKKSNDHSISLKSPPPPVRRSSSIRSVNNGSDIEKTMIAFDDSSMTPLNDLTMRRGAIKTTRETGRIRTKVAMIMSEMRESIAMLAPLASDQLEYVNKHFEETLQMLKAAERG